MPSPGYCFRTFVRISSAFFDFATFASQSTMCFFMNWMAEISKIGEMYSSTARDAYKPVEKTLEKHKA